MLLGASASKIRPSEITVLALRKDQMTTGRRNSPVPQLRCRGKLCSEFTPATVLCTNMGSDGRDMQWKCEADMPDGYRFGTIDVSCEGYSFPDDEYILAGSCGLTYDLEGPGQPKKAYHSPYYDSATGPTSQSNSSSSTFGTLVWYAAIAVLIYAVIKVWKGRVGHAGGGGGGGFRPDPWNPPRGAPPPYSEPGTKGSPPTAGFGAAPSQGPGFWSGLLGGGALGYMMGNRNNRNRDNVYGNVHRQTGLGSRYTAGAPPASNYGESESRGNGGGGGVRTAYGGTSRR